MSCSLNYINMGVIKADTQSLGYSSHQHLLQIVGAVVIARFGIHVFVLGMFC